MLAAVTLLKFITETPLSTQKNFYFDIDEFGVSVVWIDEVKIYDE